MKPKIVFFLVFSFISVCFAQNNHKKISVSGVVVDSHKRPVPDASITIDGKKTGETTDSKGYYKVKIRPTAEKIGIYTLPPASIEELINGRTSIDFTLNDSIAMLVSGQIDQYLEKEVNVGYGTQKRINSTSSVTNIDVNQKKSTTYTNIYDMLRGEVPGISVVGSSVIIRGGANSFSLTSEALLVVDGTPVRSIDNISPSEVKSIDVLKGPDASIYGSRGANGVVLISLKR